MLYKYAIKKCGKIVSKCHTTYYLKVYGRLEQHDGIFCITGTAKISFS